MRVLSLYESVGSEYRSQSTKWVPNWECGWNGRRVRLARSLFSIICVFNLRVLTIFHSLFSVFPCMHDSNISFLFRVVSDLLKQLQGSFVSKDYNWQGSAGRSTNLSFLLMSLPLLPFPSCFSRPLHYFFAMGYFIVFVLLFFSFPYSAPFRHAWSYFYRMSPLQPTEEAGSELRTPVGLSIYRAVAGIVKSRGEQGATIQLLGYVLHTLLWS